MIHWAVMDLNSSVWQECFPSSIANTMFPWHCISRHLPLSLPPWPSPPSVSSLHSNEGSNVHISSTSLLPQCSVLRLTITAFIIILEDFVDIERKKELILTLTRTELLNFPFWHFIICRLIFSLETNIGQNLYFHYFII